MSGRGCPEWGPGWTCTRTDPHPGGPCALVRTRHRVTVALLRRLADRLEAGRSVRFDGTPPASWEPLSAALVTECTCYWLDMGPRCAFCVAVCTAKGHPWTETKTAGVHCAPAARQGCADGRRDQHTGGYTGSAPAESVPPPPPTPSATIRSSGGGSQRATSGHAAERIFESVETGVIDGSKIETATLRVEADR